ncbi:MAG TPA: secretin N-terminal domain-containing protein [Steroidobacteraceae bacterium]|nr:secretin N-terminal domain-containing protein [Steroidobacteraceae bacterium]
MKTMALSLTTILLALPLSGIAADIESKPATSDSLHDAGDVDTRALIREVGDRMHKHFVSDPRVPQTLSLGALNRQDVTYGQLLALLQVHGFAVVQDDGIMEVVPDAGIRFAGLPVVPYDNIKALDNEWVTAIIPVKGMSAVQLVTILRPLVPPVGQINALVERNAMIVCDRSANVRRLVELIKGLEALPAVTPEARHEP